jgi:SAM-dependent methyltransferase
MPELSSAKGAAVYTRPFLRIYDWWVLGIVNSLSWRCSTTKILLPFFASHLPSNHLDIGVGPGYYLSHCSLTPEHHITLMDLNKNSLETTNARIGNVARMFKGDALAPSLPFMKEEKFESISLIYLLHCMPGPLERKKVLFENLREYLADDGVLYGTTILGKDVKHNLFGKFLMLFLNTVGIFGNWGDSEEGYEAALKENFEDVDVRVVEVVLLFTAKKPKKDVRVSNGGRRTV